jgi:hypothetical protein
MQNYQVEPLFISLPKIEMERDKLDVRTFAFIRLVELEIKKKLFFLLRSLKNSADNAIKLFWGFN